MNMNSMKVLLLGAFLVLFAGASFAQEEMTKDQWQQETARYTRLRDDERAKLQTLTNEVNALQAQSNKLDADLNGCMDALYALVGATSQSAADYRAELEAAERKADELLRLSDADLASRRSEVDDLEATAKRLRDNKLSYIPEFSSRLDALDKKVASLRKALGTPFAGGMYTVVRGDYLFAIAKKTSTYNNGFMWPKIWRANASKIKNPDLIYPRQKFKMPAGSELNSDEKKWLDKYWSTRKKAD